MMTDLSESPALHTYVGNDSNIEIVRYLLAVKRNPNEQDIYGYAPLHKAAQSRAHSTKIAQELIDSGADVNLTDSDGLSPLHFAVVNRKREMIEILIQNGADINAATNSGTRALHYAINNNMYVFLRCTKMHERFDTGTPDLNIIKRFLENENLDINAANRLGETPLMWAVADRHTGVVKLLLGRGADPNTINIYGDSPLHKAFAGSRPCIDIARLLLRHGADVCRLDAKNETPIDIIIERIKDTQSLEFAKEFLKLVAFQNNSNKVKMNLKMHRQVLKFYEACCEEVERMKYQIISRNLTVHDFILGCYNEKEFADVMFDIYNPLFNILNTRCYSIYLIDILRCIEVPELRTRFEKQFLFTKVNEI